MSSSIFVRPASSATDDGLRLLRNFDSQLSWLSSIGSNAQWGTTSRSDQEDQRAKYRDIVQRSEQCWNNPFNRDLSRVYIAETQIQRDDLSSELSDVAIDTDNTKSTVRLPVAGMILTGKSSDYTHGVIPENDDDDPFIFVLYLLSDRSTAAYGKGAGAMMIAHAKDEARKLGIKRLCVDCWRGNDGKLVRYYEQQGFKVIGTFDTEKEDKSIWSGAVLEMRL